MKESIALHIISNEDSSPLIAMHFYKNQKHWSMKLERIGVTNFERFVQA